MEELAKINISDLRQCAERIAATGLLSGGVNAPYKRFAAGKTSAQAEFTAQLLAAFPPCESGVSPGTGVRAVPAAPAAASAASPRTRSSPKRCVSRRLLGRHAGKPPGALPLPGGFICAFALLENDFGFRRFLTRDRANIRAELFLLAMAFDLKKLRMKREHGADFRPVFPRK